MEKHYAPIAFFVYKRPGHTRRTLEALAANELASKSDLFIFSDGPRSEQDEQGVRAVRECVRAAKGFKSVRIMEHERNQGLAKSLIGGITELCDRFGQVIVVEDDVLVSPRFLRFMNDALQRYENNDEIFSICAFWPLKPKLDDGTAFFLNYFAVWGWATWKRAWDYYDYEAAGWEELLKNKRMAWDFDLEGRYDFTAMLLSQVRSDIHTWDIQWSWITYREKKLCLFPPYGLTVNIGFDGLGEHTNSQEERWLAGDIDLNLKRKITFPARMSLDESKRVLLGKFFYQRIKNRRGFSLRGIFWTFYRFLRRMLLSIPCGIEIKNNIRL